MTLTEFPELSQDIQQSRQTCSGAGDTTSLVRNEIEDSLRYPHQSPTSLDDAVATLKPIDIASLVDDDDRPAPPQLLLNRFAHDGFNALREDVLFKVIRIRDVKRSLLTHLLMDAFHSGKPAVLGEREFRVRDAKIAERDQIIFTLEPFDPTEAPWNAMLNT